MPTLPKIDNVSLKILFLLVPGIIALGIVKRAGPKRPRTDFESGIQIFVYGVFIYAVVGLINGLSHWIFYRNEKTDFWHTVIENSLKLASLDPSNGLDAGQAAFAIIVAFIVGMTVSAFETRNIPHRFLQKTGITKRINEVDIWGFTFNSPDIESWVVVRHHANGKVYQGWVRGYSEGGDERELLLRDVKVYVKQAESDDLMEVDTVPVLYLGLDRKNAVIELISKPQRVN